MTILTDHLVLHAFPVSRYVGCLPEIYIKSLVIPVVLVLAG